MEWPTEANNVDKTKEASTTDTRKDALYSNEDLAEEEFDDEGILDLADSFDEEVGAFSEVSERMAAIIEEVGNRARTRTTEYNTVQKSISEIKDASGERQLTIRQRQNIRKNARRVVNDSACDFDQFVDGMIRELPAFKQHLNGVMQTFARAVPLYVEMDEEQRELQREEVSNILTSTDGMISSMEGFEQSIRVLPKMTTTFNRSRKSAERVLREVVHVMKDGRSSIEGLLSLLD